MATATIYWIPGGGAYSQSQDIYYKAIDNPGWTFHSNVSAGVNTADVTGLSENAIYQFRVSNICTGGSSSFSNTGEAIYINCPTVNINQGETAAAFNFTHLGGDISDYLMELLTVADVVIDSLLFNSPGANIAGTFSGLSPGTDYKIRVTPKATGGLGDHIAVCGSVSFRTNDVVCDPPTDVSAVMS